jgi:hypothetical protein
MGTWSQAAGLAVAANACHRGVEVTQGIKSLGIFKIGYRVLNAIEVSGEGARVEANVKGDTSVTIQVSPE